MGEKRQTGAPHDVARTSCDGPGRAAGDFGYFVRPAEETGTGLPRVEPCLGYLVDHPAGMVLLDTGMGTYPDVDAHNRPRRLRLLSHSPTSQRAGGHPNRTLVVRRRDGTVVVAGQRHDTASACGADLLAWQAQRGDDGPPLPVPPA